MPAPDKFSLMRLGRRRAAERMLREKINRDERDEVATWRPLRREDFPEAPQPSLPSGIRHAALAPVTRDRGPAHRAAQLENDTLNAPDTGPVAPNPERELSFSEKAVGLSFNPSQDPAVYACKSGFAHVIDQMDRLRATSDNPEVRRMASIAITEAQTAQMWAVKAITWRG